VAHERDFSAVLGGAKEGASWAVSRLFEDLQPRLLRYLRGRSRDVAEDLAGDVWEAIARGIRDFDGDESDFRAWAFTIARRRLIDHQRKSLRRKTDATDRDDLAALPAVASTDGDAIERLSAQEAVAVISATLSEEQAEVVLLRVVAGLETSLVAAVMERTETWVRVTQHRAMKRLADRFVPETSGSM
jgi:RNA polymerase sigma-70 factor (ECF subfamily)